MTHPKAYIFDVFGTIVDWRTSFAREVALVFDRKGIETDAFLFAETWRSQYQPAMERIRSGNRGYIALDILHRENLDETLKILNLEHALDTDERDDLNKAWEKLDPWDDVSTGLLSLKNKAIIAPCSNGSIALMTRLARYGGLPWDCILGAEIAQNYKPEPAVYHGCCNALQMQPADVMMVAAHNDDLEAARSCGLQTAFIARSTEYGPNQKSDLVATSDWGRVVTQLVELANG